jgi:hypothetical protein
MKRVVFFLSIFFLVSSCKKGEEKTSWSIDALAPLATTSLSLTNLVKDSTIKTNADNSLTLDYRTTVYELSLADQFVKIPDTAITQKYTVDSIGLPRVTLIYHVTLGSLADVLSKSSDPLQMAYGNFILSHNGQNATISAFNGFSTPPYAFDGSSYFKTMTVSQGRLGFWVINHLPVDLTNISYEGRNATSNTLILSDNIPFIPRYDSVYQDKDLAGKTIEGSINFKITNFNSPGSTTPVLLDTSDYIQVSGYLYGLRATNAIAKFPSQDLINSSQEVAQNIGDRKLSYVDCREGDLTVTIVSSVQEQMHLKYKLVGAFDKYGKPLEKETLVSPAVPGQPTVIQQTFPLAGYAINLTGVDGSKFNTYTQLIIAHIDSSGIERQITSTDSLQMTYRIRNIRPNYIKGYVGRDTVNIKGDSPFDFTNMFKNSAPNALKFENVKMSLSIENGLGVDGNVKINNLSGINANGNSVALSDFSSSPIIGTTQHINRATDFPLTPAVSNFVLQSASSNINDFISNLPNKISYDVQIKTNPSGNRNTYDDFAYLESRLKVNLDINMPLSLLANNLILKDSFGFSLGSSTKEIDNIKDGTLHLITQNKFPIQSDIELLVFDENWNLLDSLVSNARVDAADLNGACRAEVAKRNVINIPLSGARLEKIKSAKHAVVTAVFNTKATGTCNGQYLKIYSDYKLDAKITADFNYKIKF